MSIEVRIDKFIWAVRLFKTRSLAADECKKNRVMINGSTVKSSRMVRVGDKVDIVRPPVTYSYKVLDVAEKRMGAKLVAGFIKDITTAEQIEVLEMSKLTHSLGRPKGSGRPTKRERRDIDKLMDWDD